MDAPTLTSIFSGGILLTTGVVGYYSYRAARSGPRKVPRWNVRRINASAVELLALEDNPVVENVTLTFPGEPDSTPHVEGPTGWDKFSPNQTEVFYPLWPSGTADWDQRVRLQWKPTHKDDPGVWDSTVSINYA